MDTKTKAADHYDEIARCNRCGFCQAACPVYQATGHEAGVARGRLALLRALVEGRLPWSKELEEPLYTCLLCGACTANCFPAVPTADLLLAARAEYLERVDRKPSHRLLFDHLLPHPERLRLAAKAAALGAQSGLTDAAKALGLLRIFGRDFPRAVETVESFPGYGFREKVPPGILKGSGKSGRVGYFVGCGMDVLFPRAAEVMLGILRQMGESVRVLDNCCCGLPAMAYGDLEAARRLALKNIERIGNEDLDVIIVDCSSCASHLKNYPRLFPESDAVRARAQALAAKVRDMVEFVPPLKSPCPSTPTEMVATYHDPCHASRGQGLVKEPRELLASLPGIVYRELPEADWCCGGAGSYALGHYDISMRVLDRKMENVRKTGAQLLVTSCPACMVQLSHGARRHGLSLHVCHLSEVVAGVRGRP